MRCKICSGTSKYFTSAIILFKYSIKYFKCTECGFIQTEEPFWLKEAYSSAITASDVGLVRRNAQLALITKVILKLYYNPRGHFLDFAGGYGLFVRQMRDNGFDFLWHDKFCRNIFANGFEFLENDDVQFELVTAFEFFEHLVDPLIQVESLTKLSRNILFSTELIPKIPPHPTEWWYYGLEHGQHVSLYSQASLAKLSEMFGLHYYSNGINLHLITDKKINPVVFNICSHLLPARLLSSFMRDCTLIDSDFERITGYKINT